MEPSLKFGYLEVSLYVILAVGDPLPNAASWMSHDLLWVMILDQHL